MTHYKAATSDRVNSLRSFHDEVRSADLKVDEKFQAIFMEAQAFLEMSDREIADALSVSRPTVNRWGNGKNLPYNALRKHIAIWIGEQLSAKIRRLEASANQFAASSSARQVAASSSSHDSRPMAMVAKGR